MKALGFEVAPPTFDRALAAFLIDKGWLGRSVLRAFREVVGPGDRVVDVGANQGLFTLFFSELVGPDGRVLALEPDPILFDALQLNCERNGVRNVDCRRVAASNRAGSAWLRRSRVNRGDNRIEERPREKSVRVEICTMDKLVGDAPLEFVKIDVQGHEAEVLQGLGVVLDRNPRLKVFLELWPHALAARGHGILDTLHPLLVRGYRLLEARRDGLVNVTTSELAGRRWGRFGDTNILAVRD
jgi:FkbM family methyltransferase